MENKHAFISYLESLKEERGKLAALRRGLGFTPGTCTAMYPVVAVRLPRDCSHFTEQLYYLVTALFGFHPSMGKKGNLGDHLREAYEEEITSSVERRFIRLLGTPWEDLHHELRHIVSLLKSKAIPINWHQIIADLRYWSHPDHFVQRRWANAFWGFKENLE